jgi:site-specific DNA-methyltransferase (adenine-specific)
MLEINRIYNSDCLEGMKLIDDKSIDLILCDLPYGTSACKWDSIIPFDKLWEQYKRIIKTEGAIVLTASQPFTSLLINSNIPMFKYEWIWKKSICTGYFDVQYRPMKQHENILVFGFGGVSNCSNPKMNYYPQGTIPLDKPKKRADKKTNATCRSEVVAHGEQTQTNFPKSVLEFSSEGKTVHPTQKPLALFEYLVKTYTKEGDLVLDNTCGSGTTCLAAKNTQRNFIGFENDESYYKIACNRIGQI